MSDSDERTRHTPHGVAHSDGVEVVTRAARRRRTRRAWFSVVAMLAVAGAVLSSPAYASATALSPLAGPVLPLEPDGRPDRIPDTGSRPGGTTPGGTTPGSTNPMLPPQPAPPPVGPLATQIMNEQRAVESIGERLKEARDTLQRIRQVANTARRAAADAERSLQEARKHAKEAASRAYRDAARVPPQIAAFAAQFRHVGPGLRARAVARDKSAGWAVKRAEELARLTAQSRDTATLAEQTATNTLSLLQQQYNLRSQALQELVNQNAEALRLAEQARNEYESDYGDELLGRPNNGMVAHPKAIAAVKYALRQRGKPYVWGAEGPDAFDCSGLVWAAYRSAGVTLPRVARPQYLATAHARVGVQQLLPGDLIFFGPDRSSWTSIHHVGIYIGNGRMVHAPNSRTVVKVAPIWWSEFWGATRVVPAVKASPPKPSPKPTPTPTTPPSTPPTTPPSSPPPWSPSPGPSGSGTPTPNGTSSSGPTPNSSRSFGPGTPQPSPNPPPTSRATSGGESTPAGAATACPTDSASPSPSTPNPTPSGTPSATPSCHSG